MKKNIFKTAIVLCLFGMMSCGGSDGDNSEEIEKNARLMQKFVVDISEYAKTKSSNPNFIIIPQNGAELAFKNTEPDDGFMTDYINAIDGIGIEELFYDGGLDVDYYRLDMLKTLKNHVTIMVSDYVSNSVDIADAKKRSKDKGFIAFPRSSNNYYYEIIPTLDSADVNPNDVNQLSDAKNYLYYIGHDPKKYADAAAMISAVDATSYDVVLIDLFWSGNTEFTPTEINLLKTKPDGKKRLVIAYISIGSAEKYRYYWQSGWKKGNPAWIKKSYENYPYEFWVEFWHQDWQDIIFGNSNSYIDKIIAAGFDGVYLDNVEAYYFLVED